MANIKFIAVSRSLSGILDYVTNREKTVERLISGVNCMAQTAQDEFEAVKKQFRKTDGRSYYHIVQAFAPDDPLDFDTAHEIGLKFAEYFKSYQCVVVTHMNTAHIHNHIIMNSVNFETGQKFHQSAREMQQARSTATNSAGSTACPSPRARQIRSVFLLGRNGCAVPLRRLWRTVLPVRSSSHSWRSYGYKGTMGAESKIHHLHHTGECPMPRQ